MFGGRLGIPELLIVLVIASFFFVFRIVAWWRILTKAGHPAVLSLIMLIPVGELFLLFWFAFTDWPIEKKAAGTTQAFS